MSNAAHTLEPEHKILTMSKEDATPFSSMRTLLGRLGVALGYDLVYCEKIEENSAMAYDSLGFLDIQWRDGENLALGFLCCEHPDRLEGLQQLADYLALHPKVKTEWFVVATEDSREAVESELNRPIYQCMKKPLPKACSLIAWEKLESEVESLGSHLRYLKVDFIRDLAAREA